GCAPRSTSGARCALLSQLRVNRVIVDSTIFDIKLRRCLIVGVLPMSALIDNLRAAHFPSQELVGPLGLNEYQQFAKLTDRSNVAGNQKLHFLLLGLFGEVGSLLSELKKKQRDSNAYVAYAHSAREELGDVLWYFAHVALNRKLKLSDLAADAVRD